MPTKPKKSATQINVELEPALLDRLKAFAEERGQTLKHVVGSAITRHLDNPPPLVPDPPLPPAPPEPADTVKGSSSRKPVKVKKTS